MKRVIPLLLAACATLPAAAEDDFGVWTGISLEKQFTKKLSADFSLGFNAEDKLRHAARWNVGVGVGYKAFKWLSFGAGYTYVDARSDEDVDIKYKEDDDGDTSTFSGYNVDHSYWRGRHRATFDVTGKVGVGRWTFSLRERYRYSHYVAATTTRDKYRSEIPEAMIPSFSGDIYEYNGHSFSRFEQTTKDKEAKDKHTLRSRLTAEYNIRHCAFTPYVSAEIFNELSDNMTLDKSRYMVGVEWKVSKKHRLDFAYMFQNNHDEDDDRSGNLHVINIEYKFKF